MESVERFLRDEARAGAGEYGLLPVRGLPGRKPENIQMGTIKRFVKDETGTTAVEYSLLAALIAVVIITAVTTLGNNVNDNYQAVASQVGVAGS